MKLVCSGGEIKVARYGLADNRDDRNYIRRVRNTIDIHIRSGIIAGYTI